MPANLQGGVLFQNTPLVQIVERTQRRKHTAADYNATFSAGAFTLWVGAGLDTTPIDVNQRYPGAESSVYWNSTFASSVLGSTWCVARSDITEVNDIARSSRLTQHRAVLRAGSMERRSTHAHLGVRMETRRFRFRVVKRLSSSDGRKMPPRLGRRSTSLLMANEVLQLRARYTMTK